MTNKMDAYTPGVEEFIECIMHPRTRWEEAKWGLGRKETPAPGVVIYRNVTTIEPALQRYVSDRAKLETPMLPQQPVRIHEVVTQDTDEDIDFGWGVLEDFRYMYLVDYMTEYPLLAETLWWRTRGYALSYTDLQWMDAHNDQASSFSSHNGKRELPSHQIEGAQVVACVTALNDDYEGGEFFFPYLDTTVRLSTGDCMYFPANYIAAHSVKPVTSGERLSYLGFFGLNTPVRIAEPDDVATWTQPHWLPKLHDDFKYYGTYKYDVAHGKSELWDTPTLAEVAAHFEERIL
jgi:hypothetical protein